MSQEKRKDIIKKEKKRERRKKVFIWVVGIFLCILGVSQLSIIIFMKFFSEPGHNQIVLGNRVLTTEVCTQWFEYSTIEQKQLEEFYFYEGLEKYPIPKTIVIEVCTKWQIIKDRIDNKNQSY